MHGSRVEGMVACRAQTERRCTPEHTPDLNKESHADTESETLVFFFSSSPPFYHGDVQKKRKKKSYPRGVLCSGCFGSLRRSLMMVIDTTAVLYPAVRIARVGVFVGTDF